MSAEARVVLGYVSGLQGIQGWIRVHSYTRPRENILRYGPWQLRVQDRWIPASVERSRRLRRRIVAKLDVCEGRESASAFLDAEIAVWRSQLPRLKEGEHYWADLLGVRVVNRDGVALGRVGGFLETGANDVLVVQGERERLIPYIPGDVVLDVDLSRGAIRVEWDPDF